MTFYTEKVQPTKDELLQILNEKFCEVKKIPVSQAQNFVGLIRSTLDGAVQYFYKSKYNDIPVWVFGDSSKALFNLNEAIDDNRFRQYFDSFIISDMHNIRKICNEILHNPVASLSVDTARDMLERLEKCIHRIESVLHETILFEDTADIVEDPVIIDGDRAVNGGDDDGTANATSEEGEPSTEENSDRNEDNASKGATRYHRQYPECNPEQNLFWNMLQRAIDENGNPFTFSPRKHYATVNRKSPSSNLCLSFDFLMQKKFLRIGIYIADDSKTPHFEELLARKDEIEQELGFSVMWTDRGAQNPNTRRIETQLPFIPYAHDDYVRLIDALLPVTVKYIEVFSKYLRAIFENHDERGTTPKKVQVGRVLVYKLQHGYGTCAQDIYDACCEEFGWDASKRYLFGRRMPLYAEGASPEGYSPWFIAHSNWTEDKGGHWKNTICEGWIEEVWERPNDDMKRDMTKRIVFAKHPTYGYVFLGVYDSSEPQAKRSPEGKIIWVKIYESTAAIYPWKKLDRIQRKIRFEKRGKPFFVED